MIQEVVHVVQMMDLVTVLHHCGEVGSGALVVPVVVQLVQMNLMVVDQVMGHQEHLLSDIVGQ